MYMDVDLPLVKHEIGPHVNTFLSKMDQETKKVIFLNDCTSKRIGDGNWFSVTWEVLFESGYTQPIFKVEANNLSPPTVHQSGTIPHEITDYQWTFWFQDTKGKSWVSNAQGHMRKTQYVYNDGTVKTPQPILKKWLLDTIHIAVQKFIQQDSDLYKTIHDSVQKPVKTEWDARFIRDLQKVVALVPETAWNSIYVVDRKKVAEMLESVLLKIVNNQDLKNANSEIKTTFHYNQLTLKNWINRLNNTSSSYVNSRFTMSTQITQFQCLDRMLDCLLSI
jgi:hypothetical protein